MLVTTPPATTKPVLAEIVGPRHYPFFSGVANVSVTVGNALGPLVAGRLFDINGTYKEAFLLSCAITLLASVTIPVRKAGSADGLKTL